MKLPSNLLRLTALAAPRTALYPTVLAARTLSSSASRLAPASSSLASSAGSGRGGRKDKDAALKAKEKAKAVKEREKQREKERKERERIKLKQRDAKLREKEREQARKLKEKEKLKLQKEKEKLKVKAKKVVAKPKPRTRSVLHPPKAPANAWGIFLARFIEERKEALPAGEKMPTAATLTKEAAPLYQALSTEEKAPLVEQALAQREAYPAILNAWKESLTPDMIRQENAVRAARKKLGLSRKKPMRAVGQPTRPLTGYMLFANQIRESDPDSILAGETSIIEQSKLIAAAWRALSESEREAFHERYRAALEVYHREKAEFDAKSSKGLPSEEGLKVGQGQESVEEVAAQGHS